MEIILLQTEKTQSEMSIITANVNLVNYSTMGNTIGNYLFH